LIGSGDDYLAPIDQQRIVLIFEGDSVEIAVGIGFLNFPRPPFCNHTGQTNAFEMLIERGVRVWSADEDEVELPG
jgi:hypothetical protein